jgi:hypothetical protein
VGNEHVNAPNTDVAQRGEVNEKHQNVVNSVVQKEPVTFSTTHQETPRTITQLRLANVHNHDNHEHVQSFDEVISVQQPW